MSMRKYNTDKIAAILILAFSVVFLWQLRYIHTELDVIFPRLILIVMMILGVVLLVKSFVRPNMESVKALFDFKNRGKVLAGIAITILWALLIPILGLVLTSGLALAVLSIVLGEKTDRRGKKLVITVIVSSIIVLVIYYSFTNFLEVPLPKGSLLEGLRPNG